MDAKEQDKDEGYSTGASLTPMQWMDVTEDVDLLGLHHNGIHLANVTEPVMEVHDEDIYRMPVEWRT